MNKVAADFFPLHSFSCSLWEPSFYILSPWIWLLSIPHRGRIIQYLSSCVQHLSLSIRPSMLVYKFPSFLRLRNILLYRYTTFCLSILLTDSSMLKKSSCQCRRCGFDLGLERSPGKGNDSPLHYSCLACESPWTEPGGLKSMGSQKLDIVT